MQEPPRLILALTTTDSQESAERIARLLVDERLAACVNIVPGLHSIYRWHGAVEEAAELLLLIKTTAGLADSLRLRLGEIHGYEVPELITFSIDGGSEPYLDWIVASTKK